MVLGAQTLRGRLRGRIERAPITHALAVGLLVVYTWELRVLSMGGAPAWESLFYLPPDGTFSLTQVLLSPLAHESASHLLANVVGLLVAGPHVEERLGSPAFAAAVLVLGLGVGPIKVWIQGDGSLGSSRYTVFLASVWVVHGPAIRRLQIHYLETQEELPIRFGGPVRWIGAWFPWINYTVVGATILLRFAVAEGNVAHLMSYIASVPVVAWWALEDRRPGEKGWKRERSL